MNTTSKLLILSSAMFVTASFAQQPPPGSENPQVKAALDSCRATVAKDANARPDHEAMKACMTAKGFKKPEHPPGAEKSGPPKDGASEGKRPPHPEGKKPPPPQK